MTAVAIASLYVFSLALIIGALALRPWPIDFPLAAAVPTGGALIVAGLALAAIGARPFGSSARLYGMHAGGLIEGGVYGVSRNPLGRRDRGTASGADIRRSLPQLSGAHTTLPRRASP